MQQRQLRLGDILDDYCPRERRVTNHAVVAMVGSEVKHTRCTTCDAEHAYKHARVPRQRRKAETPAALYTQVAAGAPKRVAHPAMSDEHHELPTDHEPASGESASEAIASGEEAHASTSQPADGEPVDAREGEGAPRDDEEGPV